MAVVWDQNGLDRSRLELGDQFRVSVSFRDNGHEDILSVRVEPSSLPGSDDSDLAIFIDELTALSHIWIRLPIPKDPEVKYRLVGDLKPGEPLEFGDNVDDAIRYTYTTRKVVRVE